VSAEHDEAQAEGDFLEAYVAHSANTLRHVVPHIPATLLAQHIANAVQNAETYARVIEDIVSDEARATHPYWGFILRNPTNQHELARVKVRKQLDPKAPDYAGQVASWTSVYMLVTTPAVRAIWESLGYAVEFFQAPDTPASSLIT